MSPDTGRKLHLSICQKRRRNKIRCKNMGNNEKNNPDAQLKNLKITPLMFSWEAENLNENNAKRWHNFARAIARHPYIKNALILARGRKCAYCERPLYKSKFHVHHIDYNHLCRTTDLIAVDSPIPSKPNREISVPDCQTCKEKHPRAFKKCLKRLVLVHPSCNHILHADNLYRRPVLIKHGRIYQALSKPLIAATAIIVPVFELEYVHKLWTDIAYILNNISATF